MMVEYRVDAGTRGEVTKDDAEEAWRPWTTRRTLTFSEPERRTRTLVVFRSGPWLLRVRILDVKLNNGIRWRQMN